MLALETAGSILWMAMDAGWMLGLHLLATLLVLPCLAAHGMLFRYAQRNVVAFAVIASMNCWLAMNATWMLADVWTLPQLLVLAKIFCAAATGFLILAFSKSRWRPEARALLFAGFRRMRVAFQVRPRRRP